jgi:hypothetical protein
MGCDIHIAVEVRGKRGGKWTWLKGPFRTPGYKLPVGREINYWMTPWQKEVYEGRNYDTFAILANVRNGRGFAGCVTGQGFEFISEPRGLPEDMDPELARADEGYGGGDDWYNAMKKFASHISQGGKVEDFNAPVPVCNEQWLGDHSHSYLTLDEIEKFNWDQTTGQAGVVAFEEFERWLNKGGKVDGSGTVSPEVYSGGCWGRDIVTISAGLAIERLERLKSKIPLLNDDYAGKKIYVEVWWRETYKEATEHFWNTTMPILREIAAWGGRGAKNVRIVFGFDS